MEVSMSMKKVMIIVMAAAVIGAVNAGNLLVNGNFEDPARSGWTLWWGDDYGNATRYVSDPVEDDYSGAVWWHDNGILQNVAIGPGIYEFGGKLLTTEGMVDRRGLIQAEIGGLAIQLDIVPGDAINTWFVKSGVIDNTTLGATTITINLLMSTGEGPNPAGVVYYDDIYFGPLGISKQAKFPIPADGKTTVQPSLEVLSWQNPDPNNLLDSITSDVYLCEGSDPNLLALYVDDTTEESVPVSVLPETQYFWRVDCTDPHGDPNTGGPVTTMGEVWTFTTINDNPPVVDAGADKYLWLDMDDGDGDPAKVTFSLNGLVTDDGQSQVDTLWSLIYSEQDPETVVSIQTPADSFTASGNTLVSTEVTIGGTGYFEFQLDADDLYDHDDDTVVVIVYGSACEAAYGDPDDMPTTYPDGHGDIDGDCDTDLADFALLAGSWMDCMSGKLGCTP
jgi:hypothetical protein